MRLASFRRPHATRPARGCSPFQPPDTGPAQRSYGSLRSGLQSCRHCRHRRRCDRSKAFPERWSSFWLSRPLVLEVAVALALFVVGRVCELRVFLAVLDKSSLSQIRVKQRRQITQNTGAERWKSGEGDDRIGKQSTTTRTFRFVSSTKRSTQKESRRRRIKTEMRQYSKKKKKKMTHLSRHRLTKPAFFIPHTLKLLQDQNGSVVLIT